MTDNIHEVDFQKIEEGLAAELSRRGKSALYLQAYGGQTVPPLSKTKIDARCMAAGKHVGCDCNASPAQPADMTILRRRARALAMLALQSDRFNLDMDFRDAVRAVLEVTHVYD